MHNSSPKLINSRGEEVRLGEIIGKGGEGSVYSLESDDRFVAKLYHQRPLPADTSAKLQAMIERRSDTLNAISAWPVELLHDPRSRDTLGILMPNVSQSKHLHELYGTANRKRHFPDARWHHMVLAARNVAAAFESMHASGIVVGDVNQGNLMVDKNMCVRFIDCDSFQIESNGQLFHCPVGTPHFTPPELQSQKLRDIPRTPNHDAFGLAIMIFHLLFVGRHPFAGRFHGPGELTIEKAIAEKRFAFSLHTAETQVTPPPASLLLTDLPPAMAELFERAFRCRDGEDGRPTAHMWVEQLESLIKQRRPCSFDAAHIYYSQLRSCPWCRIEDEGGPVFFAADGGVSTVSKGRLEELDRRIQKLQIPGFADLPPSKLVIPQVLKPKKRTSTAKATASDVAAAGMVAAASVCLLGIKWPLALLAGAAGSCAAGGYLMFSKPSRQRRREGEKLLGQLQQIQGQLAKGAHVVLAKHQHRKREFDESVEDLKKAYEHYQAEESQLQDVLALQRRSQLNRHLAGHLIQDHVAHISGLNFSMLSMLQSFGVESALDVDHLKLMGIPNLGPGLTMELMSWRDRVEKGFRFKPEHGVSMEDAKQAGESALRRFKIAQARKVLMGAKQLDAMAEVGLAETNRDLKKFSEVAERARLVANQLRDFQSDRRPLERFLNTNPYMTAAVALTIPLVAALLWLIFG
jgi:DNA-binding helix-hairpin-helix protein with protein kinase domain